MFDRYNIVSPEDTRRALLSTQEHRASLPRKENVVTFPSEEASP